MKKISKLLRNGFKYVFYALVLFSAIVFLIIKFSGDTNYKGSLDQFAVNRIAQLHPDSVATIAWSNVRFKNTQWGKDKKQLVIEYLNTQKNYSKGEEQTYLTLPEWYLVFNPNEYADYLQQGNNPSDFPFMASIDEYWTLYDRVNILTHGVYPENSEYQTMLQVIGISTTVEYLLKRVYENTAGRFSRWTATTDTEEDIFIQEAQQAYAKLIYTQAWYQFPFLDWVNKMWVNTSFFGENFIRKLERKLSFTAEYTFKSFYAALIGFGAETAYEASDGLVTMLVNINPKLISSIDPRIKLLKDFGEYDLLISVPRWGEFSKIVPKLVDAGVIFTEISGNDDILLTAIIDVQSGIELPTDGYLFSGRVISPKNRQRLVYTVKVSHLAAFIGSMKSHGMVLEHVFDY